MEDNEITISTKDIYSFHSILFFNSHIILKYSKRKLETFLLEMYSELLVEHDSIIEDKEDERIITLSDEPENERRNIFKIRYEQLDNLNHVTSKICNILKGAIFEKRIDEILYFADLFQNLNDLIALHKENLRLKLNLNNSIEPVKPIVKINSKGLTDIVRIFEAMKEAEIISYKTEVSQIINIFFSEPKEIMKESKIYDGSKSHIINQQSKTNSKPFTNFIKILTESLKDKEQEEIIKHIENLQKNIR